MSSCLRICAPLRMSSPLVPQGLFVGHRGEFNCCASQAAASWHPACLSCPVIAVAKAGHSKSDAMIGFSAGPAPAAGCVACCAPHSRYSVLAPQHSSSCVLLHWVEISLRVPVRAQSPAEAAAADITLALQMLQNYAQAEAEVSFRSLSQTENSRLEPSADHRNMMTMMARQHDRGSKAGSLETSALAPLELIT